MRPTLLIPTLPAVLAAAVVLPMAVWEDVPAHTPASPRGPELPDRVANAHFAAHLPFACPNCCNSPLNGLAVLVQDDAVWVGRKSGHELRPPRRIPRDGREWDELISILLEIRPTDQRKTWIEVAMEDHVPYEDLLSALVAADQAGVRVEVVEPALPVYPHHGDGGGLPRRYRRPSDDRASTVPCGAQPSARCSIVARSARSKMRGQLSR